MSAVPPARDRAVLQWFLRRLGVDDEDVRNIHHPGVVFDMTEAVIASTMSQIFAR